MDEYPSKPGLSTNPKLIVLLMPTGCWCVGVLVCWCVGVWCVGIWLLCDASVHRVSTQPKLTVLPHAYWVLLS